MKGTMEGRKLLKANGIPYLRPEDYLAEMMKDSKKMNMIEKRQEAIEEEKKKKLREVIIRKKNKKRSNRKKYSRRCLCLFANTSPWLHTRFKQPYSSLAPFQLYRFTMDTQQENKAELVRSSSFPSPPSLPTRRIVTEERSPLQRGSNLQSVITPRDGRSERRSHHDDSRSRDRHRSHRHSSRGRSDSRDRHSRRDRSHSHRHHSHSRRDRDRSRKRMGRNGSRAKGKEEDDNEVGLSCVC